jgi:hypothetical protein
LRLTPSALAILYIITIGGACAPASRTVAVDCRSVPSVDGAGTDTLTVIMRIDRHSPNRPPRLLVRVDPLSEPGAVVFEEGTPATAAAASAALTTSATFQGCIASAPSSFELRALEAPLGRVWLRVSSNVPVAARLVVGATQGAPSGSEAEIIVSPGKSGEAVVKDGATAMNGVVATPRVVGP